MASLPTFTTLGAGPTVLMLHGIDGGHRAFAPQVESLAGAGYRAVSWDMPGYGHSAPIEAYTFKGLAESCILLIEALLQSDERKRLPVLLGHGIGGMVAQEVVARRPDLVRKLVLCGTSSAFGGHGSAADAATDPSAAWRQAFVAERAALLDAGRSMAELAEVLVPQMIGPGALPEGVQLAARCMGDINPSTYRRALAALATFDRTRDLQRIHVPTLLVSGEFDRQAPTATMQRMAAAIAGSTHAELKGIGHLQNLEAPDDFDGLVLNFLAMPRLLH